MFSIFGERREVSEISGFVSRSSSRSPSQRLLRPAPAMNREEAVPPLPCRCVPALHPATPSRRPLRHSMARPTGRLRRSPIAASAARCLAVPSDLLLSLVRLALHGPTPRVEPCHWFASVSASSLASTDLPRGGGGADVAAVAPAASGPRRHLCGHSDNHALRRLALRRGVDQRHLLLLRFCLRSHQAVPSRCPAPPTSSSTAPSTSAARPPTASTATSRPRSTSSGTMRTSSPTAPVRWNLFNGMQRHVMSFEVGGILEDAKWQAPAYCFNDRDAAAERKDGEVDVMSSLLRFAGAPAATSAIAIVTFGQNALYGRYNVRRSFWAGKWNSTNAYDFVKVLYSHYPLEPRDTPLYKSLISVMIKPITVGPKTI